MKSILSFFTKETITLIIVQFFSYLAIRNSNKNNLETLDLSLKNEIKLDDHRDSRERDKSRLNKIYKPIIRIYGRGEEERARFEFLYEEGVFGRGLNEKSLRKIEHILEENIDYLKIELIEVFDSVYAEYKNDELKYHLELAEKENYMFDNKDIFINTVKKEAEKIELKIE